MNGVAPDQPLGRGQAIRAHEARVADDLATIHLLGQRWDEYRHVMRESTARFEEAGMSMGAQNYLVHKGLAARKGLATVVTGLPVECTYLAYLKARDKRYWEERPPRRGSQRERLRLAAKIATWVLGLATAIALLWVLAKYLPLWLA